MKVVTLNNLKEFLSLMKSVFGAKELATKHRTALDTYVLDVDYENELAFDTDRIVGNNMPYVGSAIVGSTYVA